MECGKYPRVSLSQTSIVLQGAGKQKHGCVVLVSRCIHVREAERELRAGGLEDEQRPRSSIRAGLEGETRIPEEHRGSDAQETVAG